MKVFIVIHTFGNVRDKEKGYTIHGVFTSKADAIKEVRKHLSVHPSWWSQLNNASDIWVNGILTDILRIDEQDLISREVTQDSSAQNFEEFLKWASKVVNSWPEWKRTCLRKYDSPEK